MSLRDYLLTRMALRQDARSQALQLEQTKAARQAAEQAAYARYGDQAIQGVAKLTGVAGNIVSEMEAKQAAEMADALKTRALAQSLEEQAGMDMPAGEEVGGVVPELPMPVGAYKAPNVKLMFGPETGPATTPEVSPVIEPTTSQVVSATDPATEAEMRHLMLNETLDKQSQEKGFANQADEMGLGKTAPTAAASAIQQLTGPPTNVPSLATRGKESARDTTLIPQPDFTSKASEVQAPVVQPAEVPVVTAPSASRAAIAALTPQSSANIVAAQNAAEAKFAEQFTAYKKMDAGQMIEFQRKNPEFEARLKAGMPDVTKTTVPTGGIQAQAVPPAVPELPAPPQIGDVPILPLPGLRGIPDPQAILTRTTPEEDKVAAKTVSDDLDKQIADLKLRTGLDIRKPAVAKSIEAASKITGYTPPAYPLTARELAKKVTDEVYAKRPPNNPLTALFMRDDSPLQRSVAEDKAFLLIQAARKEHGAQHLDAFIKKEELASKLAIDERKMALLESQAILNQSKSDKVTTDISIKKPLDTKGRELLNSADNANRDLKRVVTTGKKLLAKGGPGLPLGQLRSVAQAGITALGADITSPTSTSLGGGGLFAGVSGATTGGGKFLDDKKFNEAMQNVDLASLTPDQRDFIGNLKLAIQTAGKQREGGKLTDADLRFYLENLVAMDNPEVALRQINNLIEDTNTQYTRNYKSLSESVTSGMAGYKPELEPEYFDDDDINNARESAPTAMTAFSAAKMPARTSDALRAGIKAAQAALQKALANNDNASAEAAKAEIERLQREAAAGASGTGNPDL